MIKEDPKFEIQYLLSLIVLILGAATTDYITSFTSIHLVFILLMIIILHVLLFNVSYVIRNISPFEIPEGGMLYRYSRVTLAIITLMFFLFLVSTIFVYIYSTLESNYGMISEITTIFASVSVSDTLRILFVYVLPIVLTVVISLAGRDVLSKINTARDIEIIITPKKGNIYSSISDSDPVTVNIINHSDDKIHLRIEFSSPESIEWKQAGDKHTKDSDFSDEVSIPSDRQKRYDFQFEYSGDQKVARQIPIDIIFEDSIRTEEVEVILNPQ